jgi:hypothetical protein
VQRGLKRFSHKTKELQRRIDLVQDELNGSIGRETLVKFWGKDLTSVRVQDGIEGFVRKRVHEEAGRKGISMDGIEVFINFRSREEDQPPTLLELIAKEAAVHN